jgi:predicted membrane GTPase involved in stress response
LFFASGKSGWAVKNLKDERKDIRCILDGIIENVPTPKVRK